MTEVTSITSGSLIAAEKVNGTNVYNLAGENLGTVDDILIDKVSLTFATGAHGRA